MMEGRRVYLLDGMHLPVEQPGDYGQDDEGTWWCLPPKGSAGALIKHTVIENPDKTITVSPSILNEKWHGYLKGGVWQEC